MTRLQTFVAISTVIHGALLLPLAATISVGGDATTVLSVALDTAGRDARPSNAELEPISAAPRQSEKSPHEPVPTDTRNNPNTPSVHLAANSATTPASGSVALDTARGRIEARIRSDLERYFDYPRFARQRGWQGEVLLAFRVVGDGRLKDIHVTRSSGFALLDNSAIDSLTRVARVEEASRLLAGRELRMQLSVLYRLRDFR